MSDRACRGEQALEAAGRALSGAQLRRGGRIKVRLCRHRLSHLIRCFLMQARRCPQSAISDRKSYDKKGPGRGDRHPRAKQVRARLRRVVPTLRYRPRWCSIRQRCAFSYTRNVHRPWCRAGDNIKISSGHVGLRLEKAVPPSADLVDTCLRRRGDAARLVLVTGISALAWRSLSRIPTLPPVRRRRSEVFCHFWSVKVFITFSGGRPAGVGLSLTRVHPIPTPPRCRKQLHLRECDARSSRDLAYMGRPD
jgi:hypothetical protein